MLITPSQSHPVTQLPTDPTVNDDSNAGFEVGDHWFNTVTGQSFQITDTSVGAAVWRNLSKLGQVRAASYAGYV